MPGEAGLHKSDQKKRRFFYISSNQVYMPALCGLNFTNISLVNANYVLYKVSHLF